MKRGPLQALIHILATSAIVGFGAYALIGTFFVGQSDGQAGLVFVFLPVWQLLWVAGFGILIWLVGLVSKNR